MEIPLQQDLIISRSQKVVVNNNGQASSTCNVTSGVPHGSVIYDAPEKVRLLAYFTLCRPLLE